MNRLDVAAVKAAGPCLLDLVRPVVQKLRAAGPGSWMACCPFHEERSPSFHVSRELFHCFGCGASGDAISFIMALDGVSFLEAVLRLGGPGLDLHQARQQAAERAALAERQEAARRANGRSAAGQIWDEARSATGTKVETYLRARGIDVAALGGMPACLRYHPDLWHRGAGRGLPAMVACMQAADGEVVGVHRTYLRPDGRGKADVPGAKLMLGPCFGAAIRLIEPDAPGTPGDILAVGEGIETTLSFLVLCQRAGLRLGGWAAGSLGALVGAAVGGYSRALGPHGRRLPGLRPDPARPGVLPPPGVRMVYQLIDMDGDRASAEALIARGRAKWAALGLTSKNARPGDGRDWNDELLAREGSP